MILVLQPSNACRDRSSAQDAERVIAVLAARESSSAQLLVNELSLHQTIPGETRAASSDHGRNAMAILKDPVISVLENPSAVRPCLMGGPTKLSIRLQLP